jgi:hypothetical protein
MYRIPRKLLQERSQRLRTMISDGAASLPVKDTLEIPHTSRRTMEDFVLWTFSPNPQLDEGAVFDDIAELGIFAQQYQIPALSNQITDTIRSHIASDEWELVAPIVDNVYSTAPSGSPLREVIKAALGKLQQATIMTDTSWEAAMLKHAELGLDLYKAHAGEWTAKAYLLDVCRFHDHENVRDQKSPAALCDGCPYALEDCYPATSAESVQDPETSTPTAEPAVQESHEVIPTAGLQTPVPVSEPAKSPSGARVGNSYMITGPEDAPKTNGLNLNGHVAAPESSNGITEHEDVTSEDPDTVVTQPLPSMRTVGTLTDQGALTGDAADKADDEGTPLSRAKSKKDKKKNKPKRGVGNGIGGTAAGLNGTLVAAN